MGTWDVSSFGNDTAVDWTYGLEETDTLDYVEAAFDQVLARRGKEVPAEAGECAVAAAEVVARLQGRWGEETSYSETADTWVRAHRLVPPAALVAKAVTALDRIVQPRSELLDLWNEGDDAGAWTDAIEELKGRLGT